MFARRGDPWMSERDRAKDFESDDGLPDWDRHLLAGKQDKEHRSSNFSHQPGERKKIPVATEARKLAMVSLKLNQKLLKLKGI